jgi:hypothetical protein
MAKIDIQDALEKRIKDAVAKGACCNVSHYTTRAVEKELKAKR